MNTDIAALVQQLINEALASEKVPLPIPDQVAGTLQELLSKELVDFEDISRIIEQDSSLTARVLNLANSPFYAGLVKVRNIEQAITRVGLQAVKSVLMTVMLKDVFSAGKGFLQEEFKLNGRHSLACGICAIKIAQNSSSPFIAEDAYLLGLLHDIGVILILNSFDSLARRQKDLRIESDTIVGTVCRLHAPVGAKILRKMNFNERFCSVVEVHHTTDGNGSAGSALFNVLQVADHLLKKLEIAFTPDADFPLEELPAIGFLKLENDFLEEIKGEAVGMLTETERLL